MKHKVIDEFNKNLYPLEMFLFKERRAATEVLDYVQAPDALVGMTFISAMSIACQGLADVRLPNGQVCCLVQNLLLILESGDRKTAVNNLVLKPFMDADRKSLSMYRKSLSDYKIAMELYESKKKGIKRAYIRAASNGDPIDIIEAQLEELMRLQPKKPRLRYFLRQDMTLRSIMEALEGDGELIALNTDEGHILFQSAAMKNHGAMNKFWDGPKIMPYDRGNHDQILVMNPRVSISIMTQWEPFELYINGSGSLARGSGQWARYLIGRPVSIQGYRASSNAEPTWCHLQKFHSRISELIDRYQVMIESGNGVREELEFSDSAKDRWLEIGEYNEKLLRQGEFLSDINDFASKLMEIIGRLAATMHYFSGEGGKITQDTLERAFNIVIWHINQFKQLFSPQFKIPQVQIDSFAVARWLRDKKWSEGFNTYVPRSDIFDSAVRTAERIKAALNLLAEHGAIQFVPSPKPKDRTKYVLLMNEYFINFHG